MELNKSGLIGGLLLAFATTLSAGPVTVNDGKNVNGLTKIENKLNDANATVLGISVDAPFSNGAFASQNGVEFDILSDYARTAVAAYGIELNDFAGMPGYTASKRAVFVVNEEGQVTYEWVGPNPGVEPDYAAVKAAL